MTNTQIGQGLFPAWRPTSRRSVIYRSAQRLRTCLVDRAKRAVHQHQLADNPWFFMAPRCATDVTPGGVGVD